MAAVNGHRYLFAQLVRRELRQKYKGSALGVLWYVVNPLVLMGAYTLMFGFVFKLQSIPDFPIFLMVGLVLWTFFQQSLLAAAESLILQGGLIRKARFPRETIPAATVTVQLVTLVAVLVLVAIVAVPIRGSFGAPLLLAPVVLALLFGFVLGCALIVAVLHAYFRDVAPVLAALLLPWFFLSPIFYETKNIHYVTQHPLVGTLLNWVNPLAPFIEAMRAILYAGSGPGWGRMLYALCAASLSLAIGSALFRRMQGELAVVL
jgi:ABC-type polysaccharide/polyol phosphate export permease